MSILSIIKAQKINQIFFWAFLITIPFNLRVIYQPESAYIHGYFSSYLAIFLYISDLLLICCFVAFLVENIKTFKTTLNLRNPIFWLTLGLIFTSLIGWLHVQHSFFEVYSLFKLVEFIFLVFYVASTFRNLMFFRITAGILYLSGIFQAVLGIIQFHMQHDIGLRLLGEYIAPLGTGGLATLDFMGGKVIRAYGTFPHPNIFGAFLCLSLIMGYWYVSRETNQNTRILLGIGSILLIVGIFLSFSRVSWLIAALTTLIYIIYNFSLTKWRIYVQIITSAVISCFIILVSWHNLLFGRVSNISSTNSYIDRGTYNNIGLQILRNHPWGTGLGNYIQTMVTKFNMQPWDYQPPHNIFIYIAASMGILGLILFLSYLIVIAVRLAASSPTLLRFTLLILGGSLLIMSLFDHFLVTIQQGQLLFFLSLGLIAGYRDFDEHIA
ncbi:MAG TPA: O-antigen ligase family protein [Patescibacteria group bacterium]|nr:O-antigen ligase family protein [Patescibacteria group bacterium]